LLPPGSTDQLFKNGARLGLAPVWSVLANYEHIFTLPNQATLTPSARYQWHSREWDHATLQDPTVYPTGTLPEFASIPPIGILDLYLKSPSSAS